MYNGYVFAVTIWLRVQKFTCSVYYPLYLDCERKLKLFAASFNFAYGESCIYIAIFVINRKLYIYIFYKMNVSMCFVLTVDTTILMLNDLLIVYFTR